MSELYHRNLLPFALPQHSRHCKGHRKFKYINTAFVMYFYGCDRMRVPYFSEKRKNPDKHRYSNTYISEWGNF